MRFIELTDKFGDKVMIRIKAMTYFFRRNDELTCIQLSDETYLLVKEDVNTILSYIPIKSGEI